MQKIIKNFLNNNIPLNKLMKINLKYHSHGSKILAFANLQRPTLPQYFSLMQVTWLQKAPVSDEGNWTENKA